MCELGQVRGVRQGPNPDRPRGIECVRALVHRDSIPARTQGHTDRVTFGLLELLLRS